MSIPATPALSGRDLGVAERATRALLDRLIDGEGIGFGDWTVVFTIGTDGPQGHDALVARQVDFRKVDVATAAATLDSVVAAGLVHRADGRGDGPGSPYTLTEAGEGLYQRVSAGIAEIAAEVYGALPPEDLEVTRRTLAEVTRRANARLAATA
jgi:DNA-binding MarR family transcriptional regulator